MVNSPKSRTKLLCLEDQFSFYGAYHTNLTNILVHIICVPLIFSTALILLQPILNPFIGTIFNLTIPLSSSSSSLRIDGTASFIIAAIHGVYFTLLEPIAGGLYLPILLGIGHFSNVFYNTNSAPLYYAGIAFGLAWIAQFIGHGVFEGRAPALFDSLFQSLVLAVFFVYLEVLFALGYRPKLHKRLQNRIGKAVLEYRQSLKVKS